MESKKEIDSLLASFKIKAKCLNTSAHKHFRFFDLKLEPGEKIEKLQKLSHNLGFQLGAKNAIVSELPEKQIVRLQIAKEDQIEPLHLSEMIFEQKLQTKPITGFLPFVIGETEEGNPYWMDMSSNPHLLIAGASGSGKSVLLHNLIGNALEFDNVELYLSDCKQVEFTAYKDLKQVTLSTSYQETVEMLESLHKKMDQVYNILKTLKLSSIDQKPELFTRHLVILDEVGDLILSDKSKVLQTLLIRLAQKARAAGIYLVIATQRPSVSVISGELKANFPARICCKVSSKTDSMVILDQIGGESLLGSGDCLIKTTKHGPVRVQVAFTNAKINLEEK